MNTISEVFASIAASNPSRIALAGHDRRISYAELSAWSDTIAASLRQRGVRPGTIVGLFVPRGAPAIAAILGVLKVGAAYLPFDPSYPTSLLRYLHQDSRPELMLVHGTGPAPFWEGETLAIPEPDQAAASETMPAGADDDLAYVMYTSGSTGRPKGVLVPHRGVLNLVLDNPFVTLDAQQVLLQLSPLSFDASTFEVWGALLNGGTLALLPATQPSLEDIAVAIAEHGVTTLWLTAGMFHLMVDHRLEALRSIRQLIAGGDVLSPPRVARVLAELPQTRLVNGYGPTENTTFTCCHTIARDHPALLPVPIGKPIRGAEVHVLDDAGVAVAAGEAGELYAGGAGLALGYLHRAALTAERFVRHPFDPTPGARLYRTGDRVRRDGDGTLHFIGRMDRQVKINGKRVELDEIEVCLRRCGSVADAAVTSFERAGERRVAAFVTAAAAQPLTAEELRSYLRAELPDYMQPALLRVLPALPLSANGKVDRAQLPIEAAAAGLRPVPAAFSSATEIALSAIWREALALDSFGRDDNFFDLGGTSLQMIRVHARIQESLRPDAALVDLFRHPSIAALCAWLDDLPTAAAASGDASQRAHRQRDALRRAVAATRRQAPAG